MMVEDAPELVPEHRPIGLVRDPRFGRLKRQESGFRVRREVANAIEQQRPPRWAQAHISDQTFADRGGAPPD
jgi:hypothetical protein